jgi:RNA polymerase sigma-70 factor (ECF subfamily)
MKAHPAMQSRFQTLLDENRRILFKVCNSYCKNPENREDLAQEIVTELWRAFSSFDERRRFSTWMYRIALNIAIDFYRREDRRMRRIVSNEEVLLQADDETAIYSEEIGALYEYIGALEPWNRALVLLYLDGHGYLEIAELLGISETNVATKMSRLKQAMKQQLQGPARPSKA